MIHFGKGTYNVRDSEDVIPFKIESSPVSTLTNNSKASSSSLKCIVTFLDNTEHEFEFHVSLTIKQNLYDLLHFFYKFLADICQMKYASFSSIPHPFLLLYSICILV